MTQPNLYASADYADALLVARRGKNVLFVLLLVVILLQMALFLLARFTMVLKLGDTSTAAAGRAVLLRYVLGMTDFLGLVLPILLGVVLLFIVNTLLAGRLLGAGRLTSAFMWAVLLALLLFPWQALFNNPASAADPNVGVLGVTVPGALYTYPEFVSPRMGAMFPTAQAAIGSADSIGYASFLALRWARFVGFPMVALLVLLTVQIKSNRGLAQALGADPAADPLAMPAPTAPA